MAKIKIDTDRRIGTINSPCLDVSATVNASATELTLAVINRHKEEPVEAEISLGSFQPQRECHVFEINGLQVDAKNSFSEPNNVKTVEKQFSSAAPHFNYEFPAHSVTLLKLVETENLKT